MTYSPRHVFSEETNRRLIRLLRGHNAALPSGKADTQLELAAAIRSTFLPWFWSFLLHLIILLVLALIFLPVIKSHPIDVLAGLSHIPAAPVLPIEQPLVNVPKVPEPAAEEVQPAASPEVVPKPKVRMPGLDFNSRQLANRSAKLAAGGGSGATDEAVIAGLRWLMKVQQPSGAWHLSQAGTFSAPKNRENPAAAAAMALLAFQGFGITPDVPQPEFARSVTMGWRWLLRQQQPDGSFFANPAAGDHHRFYTHGLCTLALCECLAMTGDETLRNPAQKAIDYCLRHQSVDSGGWRYLPDRFSPQSDVSVTGWIVLALKSGQAAGIEVPPRTYERVTEFLDTMQHNGLYRYRAEEPEPRAAMTAEALYCRLLLGWHRGDRRFSAGVKTVMDNMPSFTEHYQRDAYYWFFASQTLFHYGGTEWQTWNGTMRELLLKHQEQSGDDKGSWNPARPVRDAWGVQFGRLYTTCFSLYVLETYYRNELLPTE